MSNSSIIFAPPKFKAFEAIFNFFEQYENQDEALCDELLQNFIDKSKECIEEDPNISPYMIFKLIKNENDFNIISEQYDTGGITKFEDYITYASTDKKSEYDSFSSGSRGQGWKIWWVCCEQINTETNIKVDGNLKYYQHQIQTDFNQKKIDSLTGWAESPEFFTQNWYNNGAKITFNRVKENYFSAIENMFKIVCMTRYNFALKRYDTIRITLEKSDGIKQNIESPEDIKTFNKSIEPIKYEEFEVPDLVDCKLENIFVGFSDGPTLPLGFKEGIAVIVRDRIVTWIKPKVKFEEGIIVGWVDADFLHDAELTTHDKFRRVTKWIKTKRLLENWIEEIERRSIELLKGTSKDIKSSKSTALKAIESLLSQTLGIKEYGEGSTKKKKDKREKKPVSIKSFLLREVNTDEILEENTNLYRNKNYICEIELKNDTEQTVNTFLEITSTPKDISQTLETLIEANDIVKEKISFKINQSLRRGNYTLICNLYGKEALKFGKKFDSKKLKFRLDRIIDYFIIKCPFVNNNVVRGQNIEITYKLIGERITEDIECIIKIFKKTEPTIIPFQYSSKFSSSLIVPEIINTIPMNIDNNTNPYWEPGEYISQLILKDKSLKAIEKENFEFQIENFISRFGLSYEKNEDKVEFNKKIKVSYDDNFYINCELTNILNKSIEGKLKVKIYGKHTDIFIEEANFENLEPGNSRVYRFDYAFQKKFDKGNYIISCSLEIKGYSEPQKVECIVILEEEDTGFWITYSKNLDDDVPSRKRIDNIVEINTQHYLFRKLDTAKGIDIQHFWEGIAILIWEAWKDDFEEIEIPYWKWEQIFMEKIKNLL